MEPDECIREIFRIREEREPDADPGDITIDIQDDMDLVSIYQRGQCIGRSFTLESTLEDALRNVKRNATQWGLMGEEDLWTSEEAWDRMEKIRAATRMLDEAESLVIQESAHEDEDNDR